MTRRIVGAVLAGGLSTRFGRDKATELYRGRALIDWSIAALLPHCDIILVAGRDYPPCHSVPDRPRAGLGPLGGLAAGLHAASLEGFDYILSLPCDTPYVPNAYLRRLAASIGPTFLEACPVIGLWPTSLAGGLDRLLAKGGPYSVRDWAGSIGAAILPACAPIANINTQSDLIALSGRHGPN